MTEHEIDLEYYKTVSETQHNPDILRGELIDLIKEVEDMLKANTLLEAIENILDGKEVDDFTLSIPLVRRVSDLYLTLKWWRNQHRTGSTNNK